jgi:glycosyltransferase involved in cell wall biosynthesis
LSSEKGLDVLLRALALAGNPFFQIVGDGPLLDDLVRTAKQLGLTNTRFTGRLTPQEVSACIGRARFLVFPSVWDENAPLAAIEGMIAGRALIVSDIGGLPELAQNGRGLICEPGSVEQLAESLSTLMNDAELAQRIGEAARLFAIAELSPQSHLTSLEAAYRSVLN